MAMAGAEGAPARTGIRLGPPFRGAQLVALLRAFEVGAGPSGELGWKEPVKEAILGWGTAHWDLAHVPRGTAIPQAGVPFLDGRG